MPDAFLKRMQYIAQEGGRMALDFIDTSSAVLKADRSVLTQADTAVSAFAREALKDLLETKDHILIEEEDADNARFFDQKILQSVPYIWAIDPIDGTRSYSNRLPLFGLSIGLLHHLQPWQGVVYFPLLREMFYDDGTDAYFVKDAFSDSEERRAIVPIDQNITPQSLLYGHDAFYRDFRWDGSVCHVMLISCAAMDLCWPTIGRGAGGLLRSYLWDFAGSWPICRKAGLNLRCLRTGELMEKIDVGLFEGKGSRTWKLKESWILSSARNFPLIKEHLKFTTL